MREDLRGKQIRPGEFGDARLNGPRSIEGIGPDSKQATAHELLTEHLDRGATPVDSIKPLLEGSRELGVGSTYKVLSIASLELSDYALRVCLGRHAKEIVALEIHDPYPAGNVGHAVAKAVDEHGATVMEVVRYQSGKNLLNVRKESQFSSTGSEYRQTKLFKHLAVLPQSEFDLLAREIASVTKAEGQIDPDSPANLMLADRSPRFRLVDVLFDGIKQGRHSSPGFAEQEHIKGANSLTGMLGLLMGKHEHLLKYKDQFGEPWRGELDEPLRSAHHALMVKAILAAQSAGLPMGGDPPILFEVALCQGGLGGFTDWIIEEYPRGTLTSHDLRLP